MKFANLKWLQIVKEIYSKLNATIKREYWYTSSSTREDSV